MENLKNIYYKIKNYYNHLSQNFQSLLTEESSFNKKRQRRIENWKSKIRKRDLNQLKFKKKQEQRIKNNTEKIELFKSAKAKEYEMANNMNSQWMKYQKESRYFIKQIKPYLKDSPEIRSILPYTKKLFDIYNLNRNINYGPYLTIGKEKMVYLLSHYIYKYLKNFKVSKNNYINFLNNLIFAGKLFSRYNILTERNNFHDYWSKYSSNLLPTQAKLLIQKLLPFNYLNMLIFYSHLGTYAKENGGLLEALGYEKSEINSDLTQKFLQQRIENDIKFIGFNVKITESENVKNYFNFKKNISRQLEKIAFSNFTVQEKNQSRKLISKVANSLSFPYYANLDQEILKTEIYHWLVSLFGDSYSQYKDALSTMDEIYPIVKNSYSIPSLEQLLNSPAQYKLKYLSHINASELLKQEYVRQKENLFRGALIFWTNFAWNNDLSTEEIKKVLFFINYIKDLNHFKNIFGDYTFYSNSNFYISTLTYWGQWALEKYKDLKHEYDDPIPKVCEALKQKFSLMNYIYSLPEYKKFYGRIELSHPSPFKKYRKTKVQRFISTLSFFADWVRLNEFEKEFVKKFFKNLQVLTTPSSNTKLKKFYKLIGINIDLKLEGKSYKVKEQILGIYSSWVTYFMLRGYKNKKELKKGLNEILYLAKITNKYDLNFNQDEIKYWFHRKYQKGYTKENLNIIFKNLKKSANLISLASNLAIKKIQNKKITFLSNSLKNKIIKKIKQIERTFMFPGERQRLAEEILLPQKLSLEELAKDYTYGIIIEVLYSIHYHKRLIPQQIHKYSSMFKNHGFSISEVILFLNLQYLMNVQENKMIDKLRTNLVSYPKLSEHEINGFLFRLFSNNGSLPNKEEIIKLFDLIYTLQDSFYKEHGCYLDPQKTLNLLTSRTTHYKPWQIKLLIRKGQLSKESNDPLINNLGPKLNLKRFLLNNLSHQFTPLETSENIKLFLNEFYSPDWYVKRKEIKNTINQMNILMDNLFSAAIENKRFSNLENLYYKIKKGSYTSFLTPLWNFNKTNQGDKILQRRNNILKSQKKLHRSIKRRIELPISQKPLLEKQKKLEEYKNKLQSQAKSIYDITLTPNQISALLWKLREGYSIEEALKIYVHDKNKLKKYYKNLFDKSSLTVRDDNILTYLAEQVNFFPISITQVKEILKIVKIIEREVNNILDKKIPKNKILVYANKVYYSGITNYQIKEIFSLAKNTLKNLKKQSIIPTPNDSYKKNIINIISKLYNTELFTSFSRKEHTKEKYLNVITNSLSELKLPAYLTTRKAKNYIYSNMLKTNQTPPDFQYFIYKVKKLRNYLLENEVHIKPSKLLIYVDNVLQPVSNRLKFLNLVPEKEIKTREYYWNRLNRQINTSLSKIKEKNIISRLKKEDSLSRIRHKRKNSELTYRTLSNKLMVSLFSTFGYSVIIAFIIIFIFVIVL